MLKLSFYLITLVLVFILGCYWMMAQTQAWMDEQTKKIKGDALSYEDLTSGLKIEGKRQLVADFNKWALEKSLPWNLFEGGLPELDHVVDTNDMIDTTGGGR